MILDNTNQLLDESKSLLTTSEDLIEEIRSLLEAGERPAESLFALMNALEQNTAKIKARLLDTTTQMAEYRDHYSRYRFEYERLVNSRSIAWTLSLRRLLGRSYQPLPPSHLEMSFKKNAPCYVGRISKSAEDERSADLLKFEKDYPSLIEQIPNSNGSNYFTKLPMRAGIITDEYMHNYYKDALDFEYIRYENYKEQIDNGDFAFLLYVSCWGGLDGGYSGEIGNERVAEIFDYAAGLGIPTIFQTIEDPIDYESYLEIAKHSQVILTSDGSMVKKYEEDTGNTNVHVLEYGINPAFHNPIAFTKFKTPNFAWMNAMVFFAGAWYWFFPSRCKDSATIFDGIIEDPKHELLIANRNSSLSTPDANQYFFPEKYQPYLIDAISHDDLQKVHRLFDYSICVNSVKNSKSMCAMRVYELQALGALMLSNYSLAISSKFPSIFMVSDKEEVRHILDGYTQQEVFNMQVEGIRRMFSSCTVFDRLNEIFDHAGIEKRFTHKKVAVVIEPEMADQDLLATFSGKEHATIFTTEELGTSKTAESFDYIIFPSSGLLQYQFFLDDALNAFKFVDVDYVAYTTSDRFLDSYDYAKGAAKKTDTLFALNRFDLASIDDSDYLRSLSGFTIAPTKWGRDTSCTQKELGVIVPIYNNGRYLRDRCLLSLLRSSIFDKMQIYLMDDGSSDEYTLHVIEELCRDYDNVCTFRCGETGSGSASRPRNMGMDACREPYITFLDPDNEAIDDGYAKLLEAVKAHDVDFAIGELLSIGPPDYEPIKWNTLPTEGICNDPRQKLIEQKFMPGSMQSCIFKCDYLRRHNLKLVEGALGEDSLFYYEAMLTASAIWYLDVPIKIYYSERDDSAVNSISLSFFEKSILAEAAQVKALRKYGVLDDYKELRLDSFMDNWYAAKLLDADPYEYQRCKEAVEQIRHLYD